jgi:hypothetical protein
MNLQALLKFVSKTPLKTLYKINRSTTELYRATFVSSGLVNGIYEALSHGPLHSREIISAIGAKGDAKALESWLDVGVSLGELEKTRNGYALSGALSTDLAKDSRQGWAAYLEARIRVMQEYIWKAPVLVKEGRRLELGEDYAELFAKCSLTIEPMMEEVVNMTIPESGALTLLEVGCGAGSYIKRACERNPLLQVVGLEPQPSVVKLARANVRDWGLEGKVTVENGDIRDYRPATNFHIITLHNLIYYFPETKRVELFRKLHSIMNPDGKLVITCLCKNRGLSSNVLNLWATMTRGCGPTPELGALLNQIKDAGFESVRERKLLSSFHLFSGVKRGG